MRVTVLGPMSVAGACSAVPSGEMARRVLAVLTADANRPVPATRLADLVWPGGQRARGNSLQAHISRWRKALGGHRIAYNPAGYTLLLGPDELDALQFERLVAATAAARSGGDLEAGIDVARRALALWQGPAFAGLADDDCVRGRRVELETARAALRLDVLEMMCEAGAHDQVVPEAIAVVQDEPWNEPVHRILAQAHYGRGDQVAALEVMAGLEARLRADLGLDLGPASRLLREQILRHEPALTPLAQRGPEPAAGTLAAGWAERLSDLPPLTKRVLHAAALAEVDVDTAQIAHALDIDGATLAEALAPAMSAGIVVRTDNGVRFASPGVHEELAELVPAGEALALHRRLGEALASRGGEHEVVRRAARHLAAAAPGDPATALSAVEVDQRLARASLSRGRHGEAVRHARRALASSAHLGGPAAAGVDRAQLWLTAGEAHQRAGELEAAMAAYRTAAQVPGSAAEVLVRSALAHEQCSVDARRPRTGRHDPSIELLEGALEVVDPGLPNHVELVASLAQALAFSGSGDRAPRMADTAVELARRQADPEVLARTLLRGVAAHDPVTGSAARFALAREAAEASRAADADELELDALAAWVPELMRAGRVVEAEEVVSRIEALADVQANVVHRCKVPMWRAAFALAAGRHDEAEVLIDDFLQAGRRDGYEDTARVHGFQSIMLALGRGEPERAADVLAGFDHDRAFEPWRAAELVVVHALGDRAATLRILEPWSARRFALSLPFAGIQTFCACLIAEVVADCGDAAARTRLAELVRPGVGRHQVLGAGAAVLGDAAGFLGMLEADDAHTASTTGGTDAGRHPSSDGDRGGGVPTVRGAGPDGGS